MGIFPFLPSGGPGDGLFPAFLHTKVTNRSGVVVKGDLLMFDLSASDGDVSNYTPGAAKSAFQNVVDPSANAVKGLVPAIFCIALEAAADNDTGVDVCYFGLTEGMQIDTATTISVGDELVGTTANNLDAANASGELVIAYAAEALTSTSARQLGDVWLFGTLLGTFATTAFA